ncbi:MAG: amidohydrolase family protein [Actinobacteria bacterium]|nr:amidohydrolase family protein [Actinomycetota bacterium]
MTGGAAAPLRRRLTVDGVYLPQPSAAQVVVWQGDRIMWVGEDPSDAPPVDVAIRLPGAWVTPGFVDAHVHATATGLTLDGIDLGAARSADEVVTRLRDFVAVCDDDPVIGSGWDEHDWRVPQPPDAAALGAAAPGRRILFDRVDGHSCLVDPATLHDVVAQRADDGIDRDAQGAPTGWLREAAAGRARARIWRLLRGDRLDRARRTAAAHAAGLGITSLHEMGNPALSTLADARAWASGSWPVEVLGWWADIDATGALQHGLRPGGDLFLDGAIGSRTAAVTGGYRDGEALGGLFHTDSQVVDFFVRCTRARIGGGVHAIGDAAIEQAVAALERVAALAGVTAVRACRHRIEHVELPRAGHARRMAALGVVASVQPAFDALWGGPHGLYAQRFGRTAALESNPFDAFASAGCPLAFGSDSTVTPMAPWSGVVAAVEHRGGHGITPAQALAAATLGGRYVAHQDDVGPLVVGHRADLAVWDRDPFRAGEHDDPTCLLTVVEGRITHGSHQDS